MNNQGLKTVIALELASVDALKFGEKRNRQPNVYGPATIRQLSEVIKKSR